MSQGRVQLRAGGGRRGPGPGRTCGFGRGVVWCALAVLWIGVGARAQDNLPGNDPAAWLVEASVQARRVSGVGEELTDALQTKGALLATISVRQRAIGEAAAAAQNNKIVRLCVRALTHEGEDGWIHAALAKALKEQGREGEAAEVLGRIRSAQEQAAAAAWLNGEGDAWSASRGSNSRFASRLAGEQTWRTIRRDAATVARHGSVTGTQAWVGVWNDPAERAWASLGVAEGLLAAASDPPRDASVYDPIESPVAPEVRGEAQARPEPEAAPLTAAGEAAVIATRQTEEPQRQEVQTAAIVDAQPEPVVDAALEIEPQAGLNPQTKPEAQAAAPPAALPDEQAEAGIEGDPDALAEAPVQPLELPDPADTGPIAAGHAESVEVATDHATLPPGSEAAHAQLAQAQQENTEASEAAPDPQAASARDTEPSSETRAIVAEQSVPEGSQRVSVVEEPVRSSPEAAPLPEPTVELESVIEPVAEAEAMPEPEAQPVRPPAALPVVPDLSALADPRVVLDERPAADVVDFEFTTTKGPFTVRVHRDWAPLAADRFHDLAAAGFYHNQRLFRVVPGFVVQWGIHGFPDVAAAWRPQMLNDEPRTQSNRRGTIAFAAATRPHTRTTQVFINLADNEFLDDLGFVPFGEVVEGMDVVGSLFGGYGETPSTQQRDIQLRGNAFLDTEFPELDSILSVRVVR